MPENAWRQTLTLLRTTLTPATFREVTWENAHRVYKLFCYLSTDLGDSDVSPLTSPLRSRKPAINGKATQVDGDPEMPAATIRL